jgi:hypothetical protein
MAGKIDVFDDLFISPDSISMPEINAGEIDLGFDDEVTSIAPMNVEAVGVSHRDYSLVPDDLPDGVVAFYEDALVDGVLRDPTIEEMECTWWRLNNLYWVRNKDGRMVRFRMNAEQYDYWKNKGNRNCILKCRQLGFSTLIQIEMLDGALFTQYFVGAVISYDLGSAQKIFTKIKDAYNRLPSAIRDIVSEVRSTTTEVHFSNGSSISVGTTARSGTLSHLHVSEYGKICAKYPDKAIEIRSGSFPAVPSSGRIDVESTAEGDGGDFYDMSMAGLADLRQGVQPDAFAFKFFFYPWWCSKGNDFPDKGDVTITDDMVKYFRDLEVLHNITLTHTQKVWYQLKRREQRDLMRREYPSYPEEAFAQALEGAIYASELSEADSEGRIGEFYVDKSQPVHIAWDFGYGDDTTIIFFQIRVGGLVSVVDCYANNTAGIAHYAKILDERGYWYGKCYVPHDVAKGEIGSGKTVLEQMKECGIARIVKVPRSQDRWADIQYVRGQFNRVRFDKVKASALLTSLRSYQRQWDKRRGVWRDEPLHNWASDYADAFRCMVMSLPKAEKSVIGYEGDINFSHGGRMKPLKVNLGYENRRRERK